MSSTFSAWKVGAPYYIPAIGLGLVVLVAAFGTPFWYLAFPLLAAGVFTLFFFRDPPRRISEEPSDIVSPADGTVVAIEELSNTEFYDGPCKRVSIFLSVFNVHVNRAPTAGMVTKVRYKPGGYRNAMRADSSELNESNAIRMDTALGAMTIRQISGAVARRIVCLAAEGDTLTKGERIGMIKFGSRTELYLPLDAEVAVSLKDKVHGGSTVLATRTKPR